MWTLHAHPPDSIAASWLAPFPRRQVVSGGLCCLKRMGEGSSSYVTFPVGTTKKKRITSPSSLSFPGDAPLRLKDKNTGEANQASRWHEGDKHVPAQPLLLIVSPQGQKEASSSPCQHTSARLGLVSYQQESLPSFTTEEAAAPVMEGAKWRRHILTQKMTVLSGNQTHKTQKTQCPAGPVPPKQVPFMRLDKKSSFRSSIHIPRQDWKLSSWRRNNSSMMLPFGEHILNAYRNS